MITQNGWTQDGLTALPRVLAHSLYYGAVPVNTGLCRPVAGAYYLITGALVDLQPAGFHLAQLGLYGMNVATVCVFFRRITPGPAVRAATLSLVATLVFLVHPIHTEVVNNIKSADEMLCLQGLLCAGLAWLEYEATSQRRSWWGACAAYAVALGSKETAVPMALMLPALWYFFRGRSWRESLRAAVPFGVMAAAFVVLRQFVLRREPAAPIVTVLNNALLATTERSVQVASAIGYLGRYVRMLFLPYPLSFDYTYNAIPLQSFRDPLVWCALVVVAALAGYGIVA